APGIDGAGAEGEPAARDRGRDVAEVEAGGEVLAVGVDHGAARFVVALELAERVAELAQHLDVERVHLGGAVDGDEDEVAALLGRDLGVAHARQCTAATPSTFGISHCAATRSFSLNPVS